MRHQTRLVRDQVEGHEPDDDLAEYHLGAWEGRSYRELFRQGFFKRIADLYGGTFNDQSR